MNLLFFFLVQKTSKRDIAEKNEKLRHFELQYFRVPPPPPTQKKQKRKFRRFEFQYLIVYITPHTPPQKKKR